MEFFELLNYYKKNGFCPNKFNCFNYVENINFYKSCDAFFLCLKKNKNFKKIVFESLKKFNIELDDKIEQYIRSYLNTRKEINYSKIEKDLTKNFLIRIRDIYNKSVFKPMASEQAKLKNVKQEIENKISNIKENISRMQNSDFFYKKVSEILD